MDNGSWILDASRRLLKVFLLLDGPASREYQKALCMSILLWQSYKKSNHPGWQMFLQNASCFNEEVGEIGFSILARSISRGGVRSDIKMVNQEYQLIKSKMNIASDLKTDLHCDDFSNGRRFIDAKGTEVVATAEYFKTVIRKLKRGVYRHYDDKLGHVKGNGVRPTVAASIVTRLAGPCSNKLNQVISTLKTSLEGYWVFAYGPDIWPASKPCIVEQSDDESVSESDDDSNAAARSRMKKKRSRGKSKQKSHGNKRRKAAPVQPFGGHLRAVAIDHDTVLDSNLKGRQICFYWSTGWATGRIKQFYPDGDFNFEVSYSGRELHDHKLQMKNYCMLWAKDTIPVGTWFLLEKKTR